MSRGLLDLFEPPAPPSRAGRVVSVMGRAEQAIKTEELAQRKLKLAAGKRAYRERNKEKVAAGKRAYRERNKEKVAAGQRAYRERNKEKVAAGQRAYYERNKEKWRIYAETQRRKRAA